MIVPQEVFEHLIQDIRSRFESDLVTQNKEIPMNRDQYWGLGPKHDPAKPSLGAHMKGILQTSNRKRFSPKYLYMLNSKFKNRQPIEIKQSFYQTAYFKYLGFSNMQEYIDRSGHFNSQLIATGFSSRNTESKLCAKTKELLSTGNVYRIIIPSDISGTVEQARMVITKPYHATLERTGMASQPMVVDSFTDRIIWFKGQIEFGEPGISLVFTCNRFDAPVLQGVMTAVVNDVQPMALQVLVFKENENNDFSICKLHRTEQLFWDTNALLQNALISYIGESNYIKCSSSNNLEEILHDKQSTRLDRLYYYASVGMHALTMERYNKLSQANANKLGQPTDEMASRFDEMMSIYKDKKRAFEFFHKACDNGLLRMGLLKDLKTRFERFDMEKEKDEVQNYITSTFSSLLGTQDKTQNVNEPEEATMP